MFQLPGGFQMPDFAGMIRDRISQIFTDIDSEKSPLAHGIQSQSDTLVDILDGVVHAIAGLEKQLPKDEDKAA